MRVIIVGMRFRSNYNVLNMVRSKEYKLEAEPTNQFDKNAIKVLYKDGENWVHFGYIARDYNTDKDLKNKIKSTKYELTLVHVSDKFIEASVN